MSMSLASPPGPYLGASKASFQIGFENGPDGEDRPAKLVMGRDRAGLATRRINGEGAVRRIATSRRVERLSPAKTFTPLFPSKTEARKEWASVILQFENGEVAVQGDVTKQTVKCWKAGRSFADGINLMELMQNNPVILNWVLGKLGVMQMPEFLNDPRVLNAVMALAYQGIHQINPDGDEIRAAIQENIAKSRTPYKGMNKP